MNRHVKVNKDFVNPISLSYPINKTEFPNRRVRYAHHPIHIPVIHSYRPPSHTIFSRDICKTSKDRSDTPDSTCSPF